MIQCCPLQNTRHTVVSECEIYMGYTSVYDNYTSWLLSALKRWQVFDTLTYFSISTASGLGQDTEHGSKSFFMLKVFHHNKQFTSNEQHYTIRGLNKVFDHSLKYFLSTNCMEHYFGSWLGQKQQIFNNSGIKIPRIKSNTKMILTI